MTDRLTDRLLDELDRLEAAATRGPWEIGWVDADSGWVAFLGPDGEMRTADRRIVTSRFAGGDNADRDAEFIAAARWAVPHLIRAVRALRAESERLTAEWGQLNNTATIYKAEARGAQVLRDQANAERDALTADVERLTKKNANQFEQIQDLRRSLRDIEALRVAETQALSTAGQVKASDVAAERDALASDVERLTEQLAEQREQYAVAAPYYSMHYDEQRRADALAAEVERLTREVDEQHQLIRKQAGLLTAAINAARGEPDELTLWSHHDVGEWVTKLREERDRAAAVITRVREQHHRIEVEGHAGACATWDCGHEDECPVVPVAVCAACFELVAPFYEDADAPWPSAPIWPCPTAALLDSLSTELDQCVCDGAAYHSPVENRERRPFIVSAACPVHGPHYTEEQKSATPWQDELLASLQPRLDECDAAWVIELIAKHHTEEQTNG